MARVGGREYPEQRLRHGQVDRQGTGRMGTEVAVEGQRPSGWADEKPQGRDKAMGPLSPCFVPILIRWGSMAVLSCPVLFSPVLQAWECCCFVESSAGDTESSGGS